MAETAEMTNSLLSGLLAMVVERERRDGVTTNQVAATLARAKLPHAQIAALLGTTADAARMAVQRGRKGSRGPRSKQRRESNG